MPLGHTGRRHDDETGLQYFRARYHDPILGRFLERDPLGYPDGLNTYAAYYVMWGGVDPMGTNKKSVEFEAVINIYKKRRVFADLELADFRQTFKVSCDDDGKVVFEDIPEQPRVEPKWRNVRAALDIYSQGPIGITHTGKHTATVDWVDNQIAQGTEGINLWLAGVGVGATGVAAKVPHPTIKGGAAVVATAAGVTSFVGSLFDDDYFYQVDLSWEVECYCREGKEEWFVSIDPDNPKDKVTQISNISIYHVIIAHD